MTSVDRHGGSLPPPGHVTPVLIVGGGPVGLATAIELSFHGVASIVIEPRVSVSWLRPRAKTTSARTMEHFRRWGIADVVRKRAPLPQAWSDEVVFCTTLLGREVTRFQRCLGLDLRHHDLVAEGGQQAPQPLIELVMRETVAGTPNVRLVTGWTVTSLKQDDGGVVAGLEDGLGNIATFRAAYVVGCDGGRSMVREAIGSRLDGSVDERPNFNITFRSETLASRVQHGKAVHYWVLNPKQPGVVGRLDLVDTWWCIAVGVDGERGAADPDGLVHNLIGDAQSQVPIEVLATDPWRARMALADSYGKGRVFLAGDAAHQNPPWGGHGFNTGVGDAVNIGWKLAAVLNGWAPSSSLRTYELERRPVAADTIAVASNNMVTLAPELADPRLIGSEAEFAAARAQVADVVQRTKDSEFHSLNLVLGTSYASSPIVAAEPPDGQHSPANVADYRPSAAPGHRLPHKWLSSERSLYDLLGPEFSLVGDPHAPGWAPIIEAAVRLGIPLTPVELPSGDAQRFFEAPLVLVRPDQHVAWRGSETAEAEKLLLRVTGHLTSVPDGAHVAANRTAAAMRATN
jgi:2-polyprenyl-6-methoxyphenol hydroxylase-like FAD-dependent oxidoreductase